MKKSLHTSVRSGFVRVAKVHVFVGLAFAAQIIAYDSAQLITPDVVLKRWGWTTALVVVACFCWYRARISEKPGSLNKLVWLLVLMDLAIASFSVYTQRGMASRAVILFVLAILTAGVLQRKGAIYFAGIMAVLVYMATAVAYFVLNFNEGYKIELYGEIGFYSAILLAVSALTWSLTKTRLNHKK